MYAVIGVGVIGTILISALVGILANAASVKTQERKWTR